MTAPNPAAELAWQEYRNEYVMRTGGRRRLRKREFLAGFESGVEREKLNRFIKALEGLVDFLEHGDPAAVRVFKIEMKDELTVLRDRLTRGEIK